MKTAAIYIRVSTEEQGKRYGPAFQERDCRAYADAHGLTVAAVINDEISGATTLDERPGGRQLIELAQSGRIEAVIVWRLDRLHRAPLEELSRILTTAEQLARWNVELHECDRGFVDTRDPWATIPIFITGVVAADERERIAKRSAEGRREKARAGHWVGAGGAPYGYKQTWYGNRERLELEIDPETGPVVQELYRLYGNGTLTLSGLVDWLNERGIPAPRGGRWHYSTLRLRVLARRVYLGEFEYAGIPIHRPDLALVTEGEWQAVQARFADNKQRSRRNQKYDYLLSGHFTCGQCGRIMRGYANKAGRLRYYGCRYQVYSGGEGCEQPRFRADAVERATWDELYKFLDDPQKIVEKLAKLREQQRAEMAPTEDRIAAIDRLLAKVKKKKAAQIQALGVLDDDEDILAALEQVKAQERALAQERFTLLAKLEQGVLSDEDELKILKNIELIRGELGAADYEVKRHLFGLLDLRVTVDGEEFTAVCSLGEVATFRIDATPSRRSDNNITITFRFRVGSV